MRILSLTVEHFKCVRKAQMKFCPGLNVLHGPNDLGKSSLVEAIRAALLLQASSKECELFLPWAESGEPSVELVFESESERIWRVRKTFGSRSQAFLEESRNGVDFRQEARGRDVDGRLSELLRWGLAPPGGRGRPKGMPITFLSQALLPDQQRVAEVLEQDLSTDSDESGKKRLIEVLQAIAEDPLFKSVLETAQSRVDEAFSSSGRKRAGKNSPWTQTRDLIKQRTDTVQEYREQAQKSKAIELELSSLNNQQLERKGALQKAEGTLQEILENQKRQQVRQGIVTRLQECYRRLSEIDDALKQLETAESLHKELEQRVVKLQQQRKVASAALIEATETARIAKENLARLQSEDSARERQLKQTTLEGRRAELRVEQEQTESTISRIHLAEAATFRVASAESEIHKLTESIAKIAWRREESSNAIRDANEQELQLSGIASLFRVKAARLGIEEAEAGLARIASWTAEADQKRAAAAALKEALSQVSLPSSAEIEAFKKLAQQLEVARAKLSVGLQVQIQPKKNLKISVHRDDEPPQRHELASEPLSITANSEIQVTIEDVADLIMSGGEKDARDEAQRLSERWASEVEPVLTRLGAANIDGLIRLSNESSDRSREIEGLSSEVSQLEQRIADQRDWSGSLAQYRTSLAEAEDALGAGSVDALEGAISRLGIKDLAETESRSAKLRTELDRLRETERKIETELNTAEATIAEKQKVVAQLREELVQTESPLAGKWQELLPPALELQASLKLDLKAISQELESLGAEADKSLTEAESVAEAVERKRLAAESEQQRIIEELQTAERLQSKSEGELKIRRETTTKLDQPSTRRAAEEVRAELAQVPEPSYEVTEAMVTDAQQKLQQVRTQLTEIEDDIKAKRGALEHVGGAVAKDRAESAQEALKFAQEQEQKMENEYAAWELLRNTLREAEESEGVHLGRILGEPISKRFSELTQRRYGTLTLGPDLSTEDIACVGDGRSITSLSVGTRDQLATIFRLSLAEHLQSAVILDDQLTQSDTNRMSWLRDLIGGLSSKIQIIVFTCRPSDYLLSRELKSEKKFEADTLLTRLINLEQVVEQSRR